MRSHLRHRRALARVVVLTLLVAGALAVSAASAFAAGPTALGVSGWQVYPTTAIVPNPDSNHQDHGDPGEYVAAPAIPAQDDTGWFDCGPNAPLRSGSGHAAAPICPNPTTIGMGVGSIVPTCWVGLNFTYFQALVSIPAGTDVSQFSVDMNGADDGARISLVNSAYPDGITPDDGYIYQLTRQSTGNLAAYVVAGEVNRVVITQVDDCPGGNNLNSALISLNGTVVPPAPTDTAAPTDAPVVSPAANGAGWADSDVTVNWNWTDAGSGVDPANCTQSSTSAGEGAVTLTSTCADLAGNRASDSVTVNVDKTAPVAAPIAPTGWSSSDATVDWNWTDSGSGLDSANCTQSSTSTGEGAVTVTATCADLAGNRASDSVTVNVDKTGPVAHPVVPSGWSNSDVTVDWNWTDAGSGIDTSNCTQSSTSAGEGALTLTATCTDLTGNPSSDSVTVQVDKTAPTLAPSVSPGTLGLNGSATASANATDSGSGIASSSCGDVDTSALGTFTVTCKATDNAGNTASDTATYSVTGRATKQAVLAEMKAAFAGANLPDRLGLGAAILAVNGSLTSRLWADADHPASKLVFDGEQAAVVALGAVLLDRHSNLADGEVKGWISALVGEDKALASLAVADATGASSRTIAAAQKELALGDSAASNGHSAAAIGFYGLAWAQVQQHGRSGDDGDSDGHSRPRRH
jgi:hypothetical protein